MILGFVGASFSSQEIKPKVNKKTNGVNLNFKNIMVWSYFVGYPN
jgi:hypothetical protein